MVIPNLMLGFDIDQEQAEYIAEIKLRNINKEFLLNRVRERDDLRKELADLDETLHSEKKIQALIAGQLREIAKKYGQPRHTGILREENLPPVEAVDLIEDYGIRLFLTKQNYFKKIPLSSLRSASEQKLKDDDEIIQEVETTNRTEVLFFSDQCNVYKMFANDIPDTKASALGDYLTNLLSLAPEERILYMTVTQDYGGMMLFVFQNGKAAKVLLNVYATKTNRRKLVSAYSDKSPLTFLCHISEDQDFILMRDTDKATLVSSALLPLSVTKNTVGIQVYTLKKNSILSRVFPKTDFLSNNIEYYRAQKLPTTGHFIQETDKTKNGIPSQMRLE